METIKKSNFSCDEAYQTIQFGSYMKFVTMKDEKAILKY